MRNGSVEHMNRARARKPASGGKLYQKAHAHRFAPAEKDDPYYTISLALARFRSDMANMMLDFERAVYPERFENFI